MDNHTDRPADWAGRDLYDVNGRVIGVIEGPGFARRRFGATWLIVRLPDGRAVLAPADHMTCPGERLVLPYPKGYVETAPPFDPEVKSTPESDRRLRLHWGMGLGSVGSDCAVGCGMCQLSQREKHRRGRH
jgi:hypothetical protein